MFISERLALAGYQPNKETPILSGLGGRRNKLETVPDTAFRETVEELFHIDTVPQLLLNRLEKKIVPKAMLQNDGYVTLIFDFKQLSQLCKLCKNFGIESPIYVKMPTNLDDLLFKRLPDPSAEVSHLCIVPLVDIKEGTEILDHCFLSDLRGILDHPHLRVTS